MSDASIALTVQACTAAMAAKCGKLTERHRLRLLRDVLALAPGHEGWRAAVLAFEEELLHDAAAAGDLLHAWALGPGGAEVSTRAIEPVLATIEREAEAHYAWQDRADING